jgi:hypothetical protein
MKIKITFLTLCAVIFAFSFSVEAHQLKKVYRIGYLANPAGIGPVQEAFRESLLDLGCVENQNLVIEGDFPTGSESGSPVLLLTCALRMRTIDLAAKMELPAMYSDSQFALAGGLMSYSDDSIDRSRRVAGYVDRILKGAKPADLPVQQPAKFEFIINLKTAKQIGLTIPPNVLARADKVIR